MLVCLPIADFLGEVPWVGSEGFLLSTHIVIKLFLTVKTFVVESTNIKKGFGVLFTILSEAVLRTLLVFYDSLDFFGSVDHTHPLLLTCLASRSG